MTADEELERFLESNPEWKKEEGYSLLVTDGKGFSYFAHTKEISTLRDGTLGWLKIGDCFKDATNPTQKERKISHLIHGFELPWGQDNE